MGAHEVRAVTRILTPLPLHNEAQIEFYPGTVLGCARWVVELLQSNHASEAKQSRGLVGEIASLRSQ